MRLVRIFTFISAIILLVISIFYVDANRELARAHIAYRACDTDQALRLSRRVSFSFAGKNQKTEALYLAAKTAAGAGRINIAEKYLNRLLRSDPVNTLALLYRGEIECLLGKYQKSIADLNKGLRKSQDNISGSKQAHYLTQRGLAFLATGETAKAEKDAQTALSLDSGLPDAWDLKSKILETKNDIQGAYLACQKAYDLSIARNKLSFMTPKGRKLSDRLVKLKAQSILEKQ